MQSFDVMLSKAVIDKVAEANAKETSVIRIISLTGFMGCGKSSVGRELRTLLHCHFLDLDDYIESHESRKITEIFNDGGEASFRVIEQACLSEILSAGQSSSASDSAMWPTTPRASLGRDDKKDDGSLLIISLGGGTLTTPECARLVSEYTTCIYLRATTDTLVRHLKKEYDSRPMLQPATSSPSTGNHQAPDTDMLRARIKELMQKRAAIYESTAHHIVDIDGKSPADIANEITLLL